MESDSTLNLTKICRVCLLECDQMYSIYSALYEDQSDLETGELPCIYEILSSISSIKLQADDGLPSMICTKCIDLAHTSFKFQKQCNQSQIILEAYISQCQELNVNPDANITLTEDDLTNLESIDKSALIDENELTADLSVEQVNEPEDINNHDDEHIVIEPSIDPLKVDNKSKVTEEETMKIQKDPLEKNKVYACKSCNKTYKYANSLKVHMRNHTEETPYVCKECGKGFKQYGSLMYHQRSHTGEQPYACKICGKRYRQSGTLTAHMRIHTGQRPFLCSICGRGFRQAPDLGYHIRTHTKEKPYMCNVCGKTMSMQSHLVQHMRSHTGERPFKCTVCSKAFPSSTRLKRHAIIHTNLKPYTCEVCSKSFNRISSLRVHSKIHTDERSYVCSICNKAFIQAHALRSHLLTHSTELIIKPMQCV